MSNHIYNKDVYNNNSNKALILIKFKNKQFLTLLS